MPQSQSSSLCCRVWGSTRAGTELALSNKPVILKQIYKNVSPNYSRQNVNIISVGKYFSFPRHLSVTKTNYGWYSGALPHCSSQCFIIHIFSQFWPLAVTPNHYRCVFRLHCSTVCAGRERSGPEHKIASDGSVTIAFCEVRKSSALINTVVAKHQDSKPLI
jgi:hypothetical protein